jgi:hypothetical protein
VDVVYLGERGHKTGVLKHWNLNAKSIKEELTPRQWEVVHAMYNCDERRVVRRKNIDRFWAKPNGLHGD